jgi:hypothetical protein
MARLKGQKKSKQFVDETNVDRYQYLNNFLEHLGVIKRRSSEQQRMIVEGGMETDPNHDQFYITDAFDNNDPWSLSEEETNQIKKGPTARDEYLNLLHRKAMKRLLSTVGK